MLRSRRRLIAAAALVSLGLVALRWGAYASAGDSAASLAMALQDEVLVDTESVLFFGPAGGAIQARAALFCGQVEENAPADLYYVEARLGSDGEVLGVRGLSNLTRTSSGDETTPTLVGEHHAVYLTRVGGQFNAFTVLDLRGEPETITADWPGRARLQNAITNLHDAGRTEGFGRIRYALRPAADDVQVELEDELIAVTADGARVEVRVDTATPIAGADRVEVQPLEKGMPGTITWVVDTVRNLSFVGPEPIAWLESRVFAVKDWVQRRWYSVAGSETDTAAEVAAETGVTAEEARRRLELTTPRPELGWPPPALEPIVRRPAEGEGAWIPIVDDPMVRQYPNAPPHFYSTFLQVDPERPFTRVYIVLWDPRALQLRIMSGTREPESATGETAPGMVPRDPETLSRVVAGFNGGFQSLHGEFGMMSGGRVYLPPKPWSATVAVYDDGRVAMGSWLDPPEGRRHYTEHWATEQIPDGMVEFRQNLTSVVEGDQWNPWRRWYWGAAPQGDEEQVFIDRSGMCLTSEGLMAYFWGKSMGAEELGKAMLATRCVRGLHLDMNQRHTAFELYNAFPREEAPPLDRRLRSELEFEINVPYARGWRVRGRKLVQSMTPMTFPRYIRRDPRDFFYLTLRPTLPGPDLPLAEGPLTLQTEGLPHAGWPYAFARAGLPLGDEAPAVSRRTWVVRIDPRRATPSLDQEGAGRTLALLPRLFPGRPTAPGPLALFAQGELIGRRYVVADEVPDGAEVILRGEAVSSSTLVALGVDADGFLVYVERPADGVGPTILEALALAGVEQAIALPDEGRLAFALEAGYAGPDAYEREVDSGAPLRFVANESPASEVLFPDVAPRPYMYWGPMQDTRVRYLRDGGPGRFQPPETAEEEDEEDAE